MRVSDLTRQVEALAAGSADHHAFRAGVDPLLRRAIGYDLAAWVSLDPATLLFTSCDVITAQGPGANRADAERALFASEFAGDDPLTFRKIVRSGRRATRLRAEVDDPWTVERFRTLIAPNGGIDEMRLVASDRWGAWGALILYRMGEREPFTLEEQRLAEALAAAFTAPMRHAFLRAAVNLEALPRPPGTLTLGPDGEPSASSAPAAAWLETLRPWQASGAFRALHHEASRAGVARLTVVGREGPVTFHAHPLDGADGALAVIVERPRAIELAEVIMAAHELTVAEAAVTRLLCQGRANREIAEGLKISHYTVQDHLKSVFAKFNVGSRSELLHLLYGRHYQPLRRRGATPGPYGYFLAPTAADE